jgi:8-oxo-dGTP pyrophosphatase MutT (NUDIX family)
MKQLHSTQLEILRKLIFADKLNYTEMKPDKAMGNNKFDFHLDTLVAGGLIEKSGTKYRLTLSGKEFANRMDTNSKKIEFQAKLSIWVCCKRESDAGTEFLIGTRIKQPFFGKQGFMSGKIKFGEKLEEAAKRELKEESNLEGKPQLVAIYHYRVFNASDNKLLEDKFMFLCKVEDPSGDLHNNEEVRLDWINDKDIKQKVTNPFESINHILTELDEIKNFNGSVIYKELDTSTSEF